MSITREQAMKLIANPVFQDFVNGKEVEYRRADGRWLPTANPDWSVPGNLRIKVEPPKPKVVWVNEYLDGTPENVLVSQSVAESMAGPVNGRVAIKYVEEVLPG